MRSRLEQTIPGIVVIASLLAPATDATAGPFARLRERREAELQSTVAHRVGHELSIRMAAVRDDLAGMLGLQVADEASRLEAQLDEAVEEAKAQLQQQHAEGLAEMHDAFAAEASDLRQQVNGQLADAEQRLARKTVQANARLEKQLRSRIDSQVDKAEGRLERQAAEDVARMAAAHEIRIERAIDRTRTLLGRRVDRAVKDELETATRRLEQRVDRALKKGQAGHRDRSEAEEPATTRTSLPTAPEPPLIAPMPPLGGVARGSPGAVPPDAHLGHPWPRLARISASLWLPGVARSYTPLGQPPGSPSLIVS